MEISILGPLEVRAGGQALPLGGVKPRGLLAFLLLRAGQPASADRIAVALWGEDAPVNAASTVQVYVSRLRSALGDDGLLLTSPAGYHVSPGPGELDAERFETLVADGRRALGDGDAERAVTVLDQALGLWRGPPLAELAALPFAPAEIARLEEQRLEAIELRMHAALEAGRHAELVAELRQLAAAHPWRERIHGQLMLALYRSGRQADALNAYRAAREVLVDQLGVEPGDELAELHQRVLAHDPGLAAPSRAGGEGGLPAPPNATIGRERELEAIAEALSSTRLLTLTGPGGVGKTRLAIEAARAAEAGFPDGARFVALAAQRHAEEVPMAVVGAVGAVMLEGETPERAVARHLARRRLLLVLDNCEHVLAIAPFVGDVLAACPAVSILATSREPFALQAEARRPVPSLGEAGASALFAARARAHDPELDLDHDTAVAEICRRLDGLPLAVELAAARCALLSPAEIAERLDAALGALGSGGRDTPARHRTLHATIAWSHDLLDEPERACFARFAVFAGGATVAAAEAVTGADLDVLDRLVAKSLLARQRGPDGATRLGMLETVRTFAAERFAATPDAATVGRRHDAYFRRLAERHGTQPAIWGRDRRRHLATLDADLGNLHAAADRVIAEPDPTAALALCVALGWYWLTRSRYADAAARLERALMLPGAGADPALKARALCFRASVGFQREGQAGLWPRLDQAEALARALGDPRTLVDVLCARAGAALGAEDVAGSDAYAAEAVRWAEKGGDPWQIAQAASVHAETAGSLDDLRDRVAGAIPQLEAVGNVVRVADLLSSASYNALCLGGDREAREYTIRALPLSRALETPFVEMMLAGNTGLAALVTGEHEEARRWFEQELAICRRLATLPVATEALNGLAAVAVEQGDLDRAARLHGAAWAHRYGQPEDPLTARLERAYFVSARSRLGAAAWEAAAAEGAAMSWYEAIAYGLGEA